MKRLPERLLGFAGSFMPVNQAGWMEAMSAELSYIEGRYPRILFALGCLQTAVGVSARTRKGLSIIGRGLVTSALILVTLYMMRLTKIWQDPEVARLVSVLGIIYCGAGILCALSVKVMRLYVAVWAAFGGVAFLVIKFTNIETAALTQRYLSAVTVEFTGMMLALFIAASYFNLLHDTETQI